MNKKLSDKARIAELELVSLLVANESLSIRALRAISVDDFAYYGLAYETVTCAHIEGRNITSSLMEKGLSVSDFLKEHSLRKIEVIADEIRECANARRMQMILGRALESLPLSDTASFASTVQQDILRSVSKSKKDESSIEPVIEEFQKLREERREHPDRLLGISTGVSKLDEVSDGIRPGHLWIIGGYTNTGKTAASLNLTSELVKEGKRVVYYSIEMSKTDILARLLAILTNTPGIVIAKGLNRNEAEIDKALKLLSESNIGLYSGIAELDEILFSMYEENLRQKVDLFVVDFIQLVTKKDARSEYEAVSSTALELQLIAKRLGVPILALSQISNESAKAGDTAFMGFKGSGAIAAAADLAIQIVSAEESTEELAAKLKAGEPTNMKWKILKNRHGRTGTIEMTFQGRTGVFLLSDYEKI